MYEVIKQKAVSVWSVSDQCSLVSRSFVLFWRRLFGLSRLVKIRSFWPTFGHSLVVLLGGHNFGWINWFWPIKFQYSFCALVKDCKHWFKLLSRLMLALLLIAWILHTKKYVYKYINIRWFIYVGIEYSSKWGEICPALTVNWVWWCFSIFEQGQHDSLCTWLWVIIVYRVDLAVTGGSLRQRLLTPTALWCFWLFAEVLSSNLFVGAKIQCKSLVSILFYAPP